MSSSIYILQVLEWFNEPHTRRELFEKFGEEKKDCITTLLKAGALKAKPFQCKAYNRSRCWVYQATGKPYITRKTRPYYKSIGVIYE